MQAAWIVDDSDVDDSDSNDDTDDGMVLDRNVSDFVGQECNDNLDLDDDQASLQLESDEETEVGSVAMVSVKRLRKHVHKVDASVKV